MESQGIYSQLFNTPAFTFAAAFGIKINISYCIFVPFSELILKNVSCYEVVAPAFFVSGCV